MDEKEELDKIISEYEEVASHFDLFSMASRGAIRPGEQRQHVYNKKYSGREEFIVWSERIRVFLQHSSVAKSDQARDINSHIASFRGWGEEEKLRKLCSMLKALRENWDLLSQVNDMEDPKSIILHQPKFEFKCANGGEDFKSFLIKNVSSLFISEITVEEFSLICLDGDSLTLFVADSDMPTSLGPGDSEEFTCEHRSLNQRGVGYKEFRFSFTVMDEYSNKFRCIATKNVENPNDTGYVLGRWSTSIECINANETTLKEGRAIVYNVNIGGSPQNVQIQQGSVNSSQIQKTNEEFDFEGAKKVLDEIMKHQSMFDETFGEHSDQFLEAIKGAQNDVIAKDKDKLKKTWDWIKSVAANAAGGVISSGILALLSQVHF